MTDFRAVRSSHVAGIRRDDEGHLLVRYRDGSVYRFEGMGHHEDAIVGAPSPGRYLAQNVGRGVKVDG
jgi:hypothetical protein